MEIYLNKFHNLGGSTISEHQRNYNNFCKTLAENLSEKEICEFLSLLEPANIQEEVFFVRLLNCYNQYKRLLEILVGGNKIFKLILKNKEFVRFIAQQYSAKAFVEELCPQLSFVCRITLINKLGVVLESGDEYFKAIRARYGFRIVVNLLPTCSENLIISFIKENYVRLNDKQLIHIYKKFPKVLEVYFKTTDTKLEGRKRLIKYFVQHDVKTLAILKEKFGHPRLGKIGFLRFMKYNKEDIINHPVNYQNHQKIIYRHLNDEEYKRYFRNMFPKSIDNFYFDYSMQICVGLVSKDKKYDFFVGTYEELYDTKYVAEDDFFIQNLPLKDRLKFNLENREHLMGVTEGIARLKTKIELTFDTNMKCDLFSKVVECCKVNNDAEALLGVLEYFCKRHKNENSDVRNKFLNSVLYSFDMNKLSDEHRKYINEILLIFDVNEEVTYCKDLILQKNIIRNIERNLDFKHLIKEYLKNKVVYSHYILTDTPKNQTKYIYQMHEVIFEIPGLKAEAAALSFFNTIHEFNVANPGSRICYFDFPDVSKILMQHYDTYNTDDYYFKSTTRAIILGVPKHQSKRKIWEEFVECYLSKIDRNVDYGIISCIFKKKPEFILKYASKIIKYLGKFHRFYYELNKMHYSEIRKVFEEKCIEIFEDPERLEEVPGTIQLLSYRKDFFDLVRRFRPAPDCKLDLYAENAKTKLNIQKAILKAMKNLKFAGTAWEEILYYAKEDYLQFCLEPLYNMLYCLEENKLMKPLQQLLDRSPSVRKHGIFLTSMLGSLEDIRYILTETGKTEKNPSVQKFIFKCTLMALCNTCDETLWNLLRKQLSLINENDTESFEMLLNPKKIPREFFAEYILEIWHYLKSKKKDQELKMINHLSFTIMEKLPNSFCDEVLSHTIARANIENSFNYIYDYLVRSNELIQTRLEHFLKSLNNYMKEPTADKHKIIYTLLEKILVKLIKLKEKYPEQTQKFSQCLLVNLHKLPTDPFEIEMLLQSFIRHNPKDITQLTGLILERQKKLITKFGPEIIIYHAETEAKLLNHFYPTMEGDDFEKNLSVVESLLEQSETYYAKILVILLLPTRSTKHDGYAKRKELLIKELRKEDKQVVELFLYRHFKM